MTGNSTGGGASRACAAGRDLPGDSLQRGTKGCYVHAAMMRAVRRDPVDGLRDERPGAVGVLPLDVGKARPELGQAIEKLLLVGSPGFSPRRLPGLVGREEEPRVEVVDRHVVALGHREAVVIEEFEFGNGAPGQGPPKPVARTFTFEASWFGRHASIVGLPG